MKAKITETTILKPRPKYMLTSQDINLGAAIDPIKRMDIFSPDEFEAFIELWVTETLFNQYEKVVRCGGAGDMGRDVIAYCKKEGNSDLKWDNYQCKHYSSPLAPNNIWIEVGKLCYYTYKKEYTIPRKYYFICQKGIGNTLNKLMENPSKFKDDFIKNWDKYCKEKISKKQTIPLSEELLQHINIIDFKIFSHKTPLELITSFKETMSFASIFGGGLKRRREVSQPPPPLVQELEFKYTEKLFRVYEDYSKVGPINEQELASQLKLEKLKRHFDRQRLYYYTAETLLDLERDTRPQNDNFVNLIKDEVYNNIIDTVESYHESSFECVKTVTDRARLINLNSHPLTGIFNPDDAHGICHHLANEDKIDWVVNDD